MRCCGCDVAVLWLRCGCACCGCAVSVLGVLGGGGWGCVGCAVSMRGLLGGVAVPSMRCVLCCVLPFGVRRAVQCAVLYCAVRCGCCAVTTTLPKDQGIGENGHRVHF